MTEPQANTVYADRKVEGRFLHVDEVVERDPMGRDVRGVLAHPGHEANGRRYACDRRTFGAVWEAAS